MNKDKTGGPLYPVPGLTAEGFEPEFPQESDWTVLDEFAKAALPEIQNQYGPSSTDEVVAKYAYDQAEAMLAEKRRREAAND